MNKEHTLLLVMGKTGSGKDSIVNKLCERTGLSSIISYTTRPRRDKEGDTHIFTTREAYEQMQTEGNVAAYTEIAGNLYWTTIDQLYSNNVYIIDPNGVKTLKNLNLPNLRLVTVFINVPDEVREERVLKYRKDNKTQFRLRSHSENPQFREMAKDLAFDYSISNLDLSKAYSILRWISMVEGVKKNKEDA